MGKTGSMKHFIRLDELKCEHHRLSYRFSSSLKLFNKTTCFVDYDQALHPSQSSIHTVPFAALMAPVAWASGADLILPELDAEFAGSLGRCKEHYKKWFAGKWSFSSELRANLVRNASMPVRNALLFNGSIDSLTAYIRHKSERPLLFTVLGDGIPLTHTSFVALCKTMYDGFARGEGLSISYIRTDLFSVLNQSRLGPYSKDWHGEVSSGLMLASLTAPVAHDSVKTLLLAGGSNRSGHACGDDRTLAGEIRWSGTGVRSDNPEITRSEKVRLYLKKNPRYLSRLRVCRSQSCSINCGECEKCLRTICELLVNGIDPALCNFKIDASTLPDLKARFLDRFSDLIQDENVLDHWRALQEESGSKRIEGRYGAREFFGWLSDFEKIKKTRLKPFSAGYPAGQIRLEVLASRCLKSIGAFMAPQKLTEAS
jgi:hypothetical protein